MPVQSRLVPVRVWPGTALSAGGTITSAVIDCRNLDPDHLALQLAVASGTPNIKLEIANSSDGTTFGAFTDQDPIIADWATDYAGLETGLHNILIPRAAFIKLKITDLATLATTVTGVLWGQE